MYRTITLTGMRSFVAVCEAGGVRAAAEGIGRSPSAVSMTLKQLEDDVGAPLFEADRRGALTPLGRLVLEEARAMVEHYDSACEKMRACAAERAGRCDVASVPSVAVTLLPRALAHLRAQGSPFAIDVRDSDSRAVVEAVESGAVEIGLCAPPANRPQLDFTPLFREPLDLVLPARHALATAKRPLDWTRLEGVDLIDNGSSAALGLRQIAALAGRSGLRAHNVMSLLAMVEAGLGATILPRLCRWKCGYDVAFVALSDARASRTVGWIAKAARALSPAARRLVEAISAQAHAGETEFGYVAL